MIGFMPPYTGQHRGPAASETATYVGQRRKREFVETAMPPAIAAALGLIPVA